jgi:hypothetical protein
MHAQSSSRRCERRSIINKQPHKQDDQPADCVLADFTCFGLVCVRLSENGLTSGSSGLVRSPRVMQLVHIHARTQGHRLLAHLAILALVSCDMKNKSVDGATSQRTLHSVSGVLHELI